MLKNTLSRIAILTVVWTIGLSLIYGLSTPNFFYFNWTVILAALIVSVVQYFLVIRSAQKPPENRPPQ